MNDKLDQYLNGVFAPYDGVKSVAELKADLLADLQERFERVADHGLRPRQILGLLHGYRHGRRAGAFSEPECDYHNGATVVGEFGF